MVLKSSKYFQFRYMKEKFLLFEFIPGAAIFFILFPFLLVYSVVR